MAYKTENLPGKKNEKTEKQTLTTETGIVTEREFSMAGGMLFKTEGVYRE